jgi:hypothetical protein
MNLQATGIKSLSNLTGLSTAHGRLAPILTMQAGGLLKTNPGSSIDKSNYELAPNNRSQAQSGKGR